MQKIKNYFIIIKKLFDALYEITNDLLLDTHQFYDELGLLEEKLTRHEITASLSPEYKKNY